MDARTLAPSRDTPPASPARSGWERELLARLQEVTAGASFRQVGDMTGVHPETVRRYLKQGRPSAFFVAALCKARGVSAEWLLYGTDRKTSESAIESKPPSVRAQRTGA